MVKTFLFITFIAFVCAQQNWAQGNPNCAKPSSPQEVLECALLHHPVIQEAEAKALQAESLEDVALQMPNPELDAKGTIGKSGEENATKSEATLLHTFELGGKRGSRAKKARAEKALVAADLMKAKEQVALDTVLALYRLRQVRDEIAILEKTMVSLVTLQSQLKARPKLTPEQEVSLEVFQLAQNDGKLRRAALAGEETALIRSLELATSNPFEPSPSILPKPLVNWSTLPDEVSPDTFSGSESLSAQADIQAATSDLSSARSSAYPDLKIGPALERDAEGSKTQETYGLSLGLALPIYHRNSAGREYAIRGLKKAKVRLVTIQKILETERNAELVRYRTSVHALQGIASLEEVENKLQRMEQLSRQGLVPSSLVLETYRQLFDVTKSRHETELSAIRSLWRIYAIEGHILTEKL